MKKALLLVNLGTPDSPEPRDVGRYLKEFLMDPLVISKPFWFRWLLVNLIVVPFRSKKSAKLYKTIWFKEGSPLKVYTEALLSKVRNLAAGMQVDYAMRYGNPGLLSVLDRMVSSAQAAGSPIDHLTVVPMYPQFAQSTSLSIIRLVEDWQQRTGFAGKVEIVKNFFDHPGFIEPMTAKINDQLAQDDYDGLIFSFHSCPISHLKPYHGDENVDDGNGQNCAGCKGGISATNKDCYRAQCFATVAAAKKLIAKDIPIEVGFQSKVGVDPWIEPFTTDVVEKVAAQGWKKVAVVCPSFVSDCLETLEEIAIGEEEKFVELGGTKLDLVPAVNDAEGFAAGLLAIAENGPRV